MKFYLICFLLCLFDIQTKAQHQFVLTFEDVVDDLYLRSDDAVKAGIQKEQGEIEWANFNLSKLPSISFALNPISFSQSIVSLQDPITGAYNYTTNYVNNSSAGIILSMPLNLTGGKIEFSSNLNMMREFLLNRNTFSANLLNVSYSQPIIGGRKNFIFDRNIRKIAYSILPKQVKLEHYKVQKRCVELYMNLLVCGLTLENCEQNLSLSDTVLQLSAVRRKAGEITDLEYIQAEIQNEQAQMNCESARIEKQKAIRTISVYLKIPYSNFEAQIPRFSLDAYIDLSVAREKTLENNPFFLNQKRQALEAEKSMYNAKIQKSFNGNISISYGLNQYGNQLSSAYSNPSTSQGLMFGLNIPVVDWGVKRNKFRSAQLQYQLSQMGLQQDERQLMESISDLVERYNYSIKLQKNVQNQMLLTEKQYRMMIRNFELGQNTFFELYTALSQMQQAHKSYVDQLAAVWNQYYAIRTLTLWD